MTAAEWAELLVMDDDGYPSDEVVEALPDVEITSWADCETILRALCAAWKWPSYARIGRRRKGRRLWRISTGGWSGHESLLSALERNSMFMVLCFHSLRRGGHYVFETR